MLLEDRPVDAVGAEREIAEADAGGVRQRVGQRRGDRVDRALAHPLRPERADRVARVGEIDLGARDVREGRDAVVAERAG